MLYLGVLGSNFENYCHSRSQHPKIYLIAKFSSKKLLNLRRKTPDLRIFRLEFENNIAIFEISILQLI